MIQKRVMAGLALSGVLAACGGVDPNQLKTHEYSQLASALSVCAQNGTLPGVDVASYQGTINWSQVAGAGVKWAYAKATEGIRYEDPTFPGNWSGMKSAGVVRGAYHFFHGNFDGKSQADYYLNYVGSIGAGDLPPMLDWEVPASTDGVSLSTANANAQAFVDEIKAKTGRQTVIYTSPGLWPSVSGSTSFGSNPLYVADWTYTTSSCPLMPSAWNTWVFWQWSDEGNTSGMMSVPGIPARVDLDVFNGNAASLAKFAGQPQALPIAQVSGNDAITLVNFPDKHMELFAESPSGEARHVWTSGAGDTWGGPSNLDSGAECGEAASFWGGQWVYPELFAPLTSKSTGHLWWTQGVGWNQFKAYGGSSLSHLSTAVGLDGRTEVFALGSDKAIWTNYWDTTKVDWTGWKTMGGSFVTGAGPVTWGNGTVEIFATDGAGVVWHKWSDATGTAGWSAWTRMGGPAMDSRPVPVRWNDGMAGHAEVFARGADGQLYHAAYDYQGGWPAFTVLAKGTQIAGEVSAIMNPSGVGATAGPEVFTRDPSGSVLHVWWNGSSYTGFHVLGNMVAASDPFGWTRGDGAAEVFAIDTTGQLVHAYHDPTNGWTAWATIAGGFDPCAPALPAPGGTDGGTDAGMPASDAGMPNQADAGDGDAGVMSPDAGMMTVSDAGTSPGDDAGSDAGVTTVMDAGAQPGDAGESTDRGPPVPHKVGGGCGCGTTSDSSFALGFMLVALLKSRRRSRGGA